VDKFPDLGGHSIAGYSQEVLDSLDRLGVDGLDLLGYSNNCEVIVHIALTKPEKVRSLILIEPALFNDRSVYAERIRLFEAGDIDGSLEATFRHATPDISPKDLKEAILSAKEYYGGDFSSLMGEYRARAQYQVDDHHLKHISVPTLIIGGENSSIKEQVERTARGIPVASIMWIRGSDHYLFGQEDKMQNIIGAFKATLVSDSSDANSKVSDGNCS